MKNTYDVLIITVKGIVKRVICASSAISNAMMGHTSNWLGHRLEEIPGIEWSNDNNMLIWNGITFTAETCYITKYLSIVIIKLEDSTEELLRGTLDVISDGIQIYDADANIKFFNRATRELLDMPLTEQIEGHHLLDVFAVDPEYSTTLAALSKRTAVTGRVDKYKSTTGKDLSTVNAGIPIIKNGRILGCVSFERDMKMIQNTLANYQNMQQILLQHLSLSFKPVKSPRYTLNDVIGADPTLLAAKKLAEKMALKDINILIQGETGTGKEIFAQGIHNLSSRKNGKFVAVNCAAFPETLIEGLLFGTTKGAFTDSTDKIGLIEEANHGTLFLDELNSMSLGMQAKLLRVLQEKTLRRVGSTKAIHVDVRVISSCNEDAYELCENGKLRSDLFYRLAPVVIEIPPLRERLEDIPLLTWHYIGQNQDQLIQPIKDISINFFDRLRQHRWPGNVRELFHVLYFALSDCDNEILQESNLPPRLRVPGSYSTKKIQNDPLHVLDKTQDFSRGFSKMVQDYEREVLEQAYLVCKNNATKTAELLKISRQNLQYYFKKYKITS